MQSPRIKIALGLVLSVCLSGCGQGRPSGPPVATPFPVRGHITFSDGAILKGGVIYFTPLSYEVGRKLRYEGASLVDENGDYKVGLNGDGGGVPAGEYNVTIMPRDYQELADSNSSRIPASYLDKKLTPLKVTVNESNNVFNFELK